MQHVEEIACSLVDDFLLDPGFARKVARVMVRFQQETAGELRILSGFRDAGKQQELIDDGRGAAQDLSNHTLCPAHAVDVWPSTFPVTMVRATLGRIVIEEGLRWGGCEPSQEGCIDPETGIPEDWNHIDDGSRASKGV